MHTDFPLLSHFHAIFNIVPSNMQMNINLNDIVCGIDAYIFYYFIISVIIVTIIVIQNHDHHSFCSYFTNRITFDMTLFYRFCYIVIRMLDKHWYPEKCIRLPTLTLHFFLRRSFVF